MFIDPVVRISPSSFRSEMNETHSAPKGAYSSLGGIVGSYKHSAPNGAKQESEPEKPQNLFTKICLPLAPNLVAQSQHRETSDSQK